MDETMVRIGDLFCDLTEIERLYLSTIHDDGPSVAHERDARDPWFPVKPATGSASIRESKRRFENVYSIVNPRDLPDGLIPRMVFMYETRDHHTAMDLPYRMFGAKAYYGGLRHLIEDHVAMRGPLYFGHDVQIYASSKVFGPGFLGNKVVVGTSAIVKRTFVREGTRIRDAAQLPYAMVGKNVIVGQGVLCECEPEEGDGKKLGVRIGDDCHIGTGAVLASGAILLPGCVVPRLTFVPAGTYPAGHDFRPRDSRI